MGKHAPRPWRAHMDGLYGEMFIGGNFIRWRCDTGVDDPDMIAKLAEHEATIRLIAAAPDMLEALQRVVSSSQMHPVHLEQAIGLARAAIAKATGSAS